ncbi:TetR family transcriptional regulator [Stackebrandtia albiflava]|uniref:TetR family transcriptional regulator n=1 Tax=Stackebrandtia albiflava TaxID=406432 RepID=A0A562VAV1_9ACTN|nr:TetR/AcrR family transcriptional regulator [Stackebrandtia albiflava]TWJ15019.1 TetR family transcriptional regulator [Stackebrandtia albiflava]
MTDTRTRLVEGTLEALRTQGIAGVSARGIAKIAGVNQALVFYHFGSLHELLATACRHSAEQRVAHYRARFRKVESLPELLALGREIHAGERAAGNVAVLAQLLAGSQNDSALAAPTASGLTLWTVEIAQVLERVLGDSPFTAIMPVKDLAHVIAAAFVGLELFEGVDPESTGSAMDSLARLGELFVMLDGPLARTALRRKVRRLA